MTHGIIEDARKEAPNMRELLRRLAHPDPYDGIKDPAYREAVDRINKAFGRTHGDAA